MGYFVLNWNEAEIEDLLNSIDGPVGQMLGEMSEQISAVATERVPLQKPYNYSWSKEKSTSYMPWSSGYTKAGIYPKVGYDKSGKLYGGANAPYGPTLFLERPARQMHKVYPFLTTGLYSVTL